MISSPRRPVAARPSTGASSLKRKAEGLGVLSTDSTSMERPLPRQGRATSKPMIMMIASLRVGKLHRQT